MAMGKGAILGVLGGILVLVGAVLPWVTVSGNVLGVPISISASGLQIGQGLLALIFGILGLVMAVLNRKMTHMLALVFGLLAVLMAVWAMADIASFTAQFGTIVGVSIGLGFGAYISMVGGILLLAGGALGYMEAGRQPAAMPPAPMMPAPPPM